MRHHLIQIIGPSFRGWWRDHNERLMLICCDRAIILFFVFLFPWSKKGNGARWNATPIRLNNANILTNLGACLCSGWTQPRTWESTCISWLAAAAGSQTLLWCSERCSGPCGTLYSSSSWCDSLHLWSVCSMLEMSLSQIYVVSYHISLLNLELRLELELI